MAEPEAAALATATPDGRPSVRMVLVRGIDADGACFYTNRESRKGRELAANPHGAIAIHWQPLARQIRLEGPVEPLSDAESDAYFESRPYGSRLSAWASAQSSVLPDYETLERRVVEFGARYPGDGPAPAVLGRLPAAPRRGRVLGGPSQPPARPHPLRRARVTAARARTGCAPSMPDWADVVAAGRRCPRSRRAPGSALPA